MYQELINKLLLEILDKVPLNSKIFFADYIEMAIDEGYLSELPKYSIEREKTAQPPYFDICIDLTEECRSYLKERIEGGYTNSFMCQYSIEYNDKVLVLVYDNSIFSIHKSLGISKDLIEECEKNEIWIYIEDEIAY